VSLHAGSGKICRQKALQPIAPSRWIAKEACHAKGWPRHIRCCESGPLGKGTVVLSIDKASQEAANRPWHTLAPDDVLSAPPLYQIYVAVDIGLAYGQLDVKKQKSPVDRGF